MDESRSFRTLQSAVLQRISLGSSNGISAASILRVLLQMRAEMLRSKFCLAPAFSAIHVFSSSFPSLPSLQTRRLHSFRPLSSLKETKKQALQKIPSAPPSLKFESASKRSGDEGVSQDGEEVLGGDNAVKGTVLAGLLLFGVVGGFGAVGYVYKEQINAFLTQFSGFIEGPFKRQILRNQIPKSSNAYYMFFLPP